MFHFGVFLLRDPLLALFVFFGAKLLKHGTRRETKDHLSTILCGLGYDPTQLNGQELLYPPPWEKIYRLSSNVLSDGIYVSF